MVWSKLTTRRAIFLIACGRFAVCECADHRSGSDWPSSRKMKKPGLVLFAIVCCLAVWKGEEYLLNVVTRIYEFTVTDMAAGAVIYFTLFVVVSCIGVPRTILAVGAGVLFPLYLAIPLVITASAISFAATFYLSRTYLREWATRRLDGLKNSSAIRRAISEEAFLMVLLLRLNPVVPGMLTGYGVGASDIDFPTYIKASILGFLPYSLTYSSIGWAGGKTSLSNGSVISSLPPHIVMLSGAATVLLLVTLAYYSHQIYGQSLAKYSE